MSNVVVYFARVENSQMTVKKWQSELVAGCKLHET